MKSTTLSSSHLTKLNEQLSDFDRMGLPDKEARSKKLDFANSLSGEERDYAFWWIGAQ